MYHAINKLQLLNRYFINKVLWKPKFKLVGFVMFLSNI